MDSIEGCATSGAFIEAKYFAGWAMTRQRASEPGSVRMDSYRKSQPSWRPTAPDDIAEQLMTCETPSL